MLVDPALPLSELPDNPDNSDEKSKSANNCGDGQRGFKPLTHGFPEYGSALRGRQRPVGAAGESASVPSGEIVSIKELHGRSRSSGQNGLGDSECHRARVAPRRPAEGRTRPRRARPPPAVRQFLRRTPASSWVNPRICRWIVPLFRSTYCVPISASSGPARAVSRSAVCSASCPASTCTSRTVPSPVVGFTPPGRGHSRPHSSSPRKGAGRLRAPGDDNARVVRGCGMTLRPLHIRPALSRAATAHPHPPASRRHSRRGQQAPLSATGTPNVAQRPVLIHVPPARSDHRNHRMGRGRERLPFLAGEQYSVTLDVRDDLDEQRPHNAFAALRGRPLMVPARAGRRLLPCPTGRHCAHASPPRPSALPGRPACGHAGCRGCRAGADRRPTRACMRPCGLSSPRRDRVRSNRRSRRRSASVITSARSVAPSDAVTAATPAWTPSTPARRLLPLPVQVAHDRQVRAAVLVGDRRAHHPVLRVAGRSRQPQEAELLDLGEAAVEAHRLVVQVEGWGVREALPTRPPGAARKYSCGAKRGRRRERPGCG